MIYFFIFLSKVIESALGTLRVIVVANGRKIMGAILQVFISIVWIVTTSIVIIDINKDYFKAIAFILGSSIGSYIGSLIEQKMAMGNIMITCVINSKLKNKIKNILITNNYKIIELNEADKMVILTKRKNKNKVRKIIKQIDENSTVIIEKVLFD